MSLKAHMLKIILANFSGSERPEHSLHSSESELGEGTVEGSDRLVSGGLGLGISLSGLGSVELGGLGLSLVFEGGDEGSLGPSGSGGEVSEDAEFSMSLKSENLEGLWDDHSLLLVIWEWDSLEHLQSIKSGFTSW